MKEEKEKFAVPGVGAIIEKQIDGEDYIVIQERVKNKPREGSHKEIGLIEIPAGKIHEYEDVYSCLRREVREETGLIIDTIEGEDSSQIISINGYKVLHYTPFSNSQNIEGYYPIMVQVFICSVNDDLLSGFTSNETKNVRWEKLSIISTLLSDYTRFYPMHISTLLKYIEHRRKSNSRQ
jgi:8-oxo-dGTP pyrophosphatase MutT (NUDIX family)